MYNLSLDIDQLAEDGVIQNIYNTISIYKAKLLIITDLLYDVCCTFIFQNKLNYKVRDFIRYIRVKYRNEKIGALKLMRTKRTEESILPDKTLETMKGLQLIGGQPKIDDLRKKGQEYHHEEEKEC